MRWVWVLALGACATGTLDPESADPDAAPVPDAAPPPLLPADAGTPVPALDAAPVADAAPAPPDAAPVPDATPLTTCEAAALMPDNDGCADAIDLTAAMGPEGVVVHGDTDAYADTLEPPTSCTSGWGEDGPDAIYRIDAEVGDTITATVAPEDYDASIYILVDCGNPDTCVAGLDTGGDDDPETIEHEALADTSYYIVVDSYRASEFGCFTLSVRLDAKP